ncbi:MAG: LysR family transcriptional regulator [Marivibrio sp.]|uniref:LysR family transcriptional regulator n=1 Tax=Marivibrio sp. TaxID=2039719 RepID=UPI0032F0528D
MDFDHLRAFVAVAETGGFSRAGQALNLTQSAVSAQIRRLEERLEVRLFERTSRSVQLTEAGGALLPYARRMLHMDEIARTAVGESQVAPALRFGITDEQADRHLSHLLQAFYEDFPDERVEITCDVSTVLLEKMRAGLLDLALVVRHGSEPGGERMRQEPLVWTARADFDLAEGEAAPLACNPEGCVHRARAVDALTRAGRRWQVRYTSQSPAGVNAALNAGLAIAVKAERSIPEGCVDVGPRLGLPPLPPVQIDLHRAPTAVSPAAERFAALVAGRY